MASVSENDSHVTPSILRKEAALSEVENLDKKFQKELHAGITSLILLAVLDRADEPMYGYQIAKNLEEEMKKRGNYEFEYLFGSLPV